MVPAQLAQQPWQVLGPGIQELPYAGRRRRRPGTEQLQLLPQPVGADPAQRVEGHVPPVLALDRSQEIREIAPTRYERSEQTCFTIQPAPGFSTPFTEQPGIAPVS
ncbi:hypothetical protein GCM10020254_56500 [Streptomyces goshikiensis]